METSQRSPVLSSFLISIIVVLNIIVWMLLMSAVGLGAMHLHDCPLQPYLPIYLLVIGVTSVTSLLLSYLNNTLETGFLSLLCSFCILLLQLFNIGWFITGSEWVYSIFPPNYDSNSGEKYCQRTIYLFAFWFNSLGSICMVVVFSCGVYFIFLTCVKMAFRGHHLLHSHNRSYGVEA
ncbi:transmembrane protein 272-like [Coregonus clupeaformis]|uniref:transmembrane protein 272-like n=1 Tax=Coregonus clupeaformis TaxID=59861 RepID=UPI001BE05921|nr:transmembrane protein 272-like [Coregonus clupeaformis]